MNRKITVAGSGYVGMSLSVLLSQNNQVILNDIVAEKVDMVNSRVSPIRDEYIEQYLREKKLHLTAASDKDKAFRDAEFVIVATPTNYDPENDYFDTSSVETVIQEVLERNDTALIVIKSTIPVGFTNEMRAKYATDRITFSPEFLRESQALYDNLYPSRIIVADDVSQREKAVEFAALLKEGAMRADAEILYMSASEAESVKLFANTYLALRVGYFNELDTYAELCGLSSERIIKGVSADPRIGSYYNNPSFGYGGYCLPKDTKQLLANFNKQNAPEALIRAVVECNSIRKEHIARQIVLKLGQSGGRGVVGVYRLIMKHNSDNFRGATIIDVLELLKRRGIEVVVYEPCLTSDSFNDCAVVNDIVQFKKECSVIIANRLDDVLGDVAGKVYTRDVFNLN